MVRFERSGEIGRRYHGQGNSHTSNIHEELLAIMPSQNRREAMETAHFMYVTEKELYVVL